MRVTVSRLTRAALAAMVGVGVLGIVADITRASAATYFHAVARADGMDYSADGGSAVPLGLTPTLAAPEAAVDLSPNGATGLASNPDPGSLVLGLPGLVTGQAGLPDPPDYPAIAQSNYPSQPKSSVDGGPAYSLRAESTATSSTADANMGLQQPGAASAGSAAAHASATVAADGTVIGEASATVVGLDIGGVLRLGEVTTQVKVTRDPSGKVTRTSSLSIQDATVAGQGITIGPKGVSVAGQEAPLPDTSPISSILADHGIDLQYFPQRRADATSVVGSGLQITVSADTGAGKVETTYRIGGAFAAVDSAGPSGPPSYSTPRTAGSGVAGGTGAVSAAGSTAPALVGSSGGRGPSPVVAAPSAGTKPIATNAPAALTTAPLFGELSSGAWYWYLALVAAGVAVLVAGQLVRILGVRMPTGVRS